MGPLFLRQARERISWPKTGMDSNRKRASPVRHGNLQLRIVADYRQILQAYTQTTAGW